MGKITIQELAAALMERNDLNKKEATSFVSAIFDVIQQALETEKIVKIKGLGTFKIIDVDDRESVNVNTGERVLIEGHGKITFTPDPIIKELVNKPFSQFETVVLNDGVDFEDIPDEQPETTEQTIITLGEVAPEPEPQPEPEPLSEPEPEPEPEPELEPLPEPEPEPE
ncbi:MAG: HU family DNA-binding protein, partial [Prevotella sp.]|nr:HU family DNA-binding protein [Prevotella sp.]